MSRATYLHPPLRLVPPLPPPARLSRLVVPDLDFGALSDSELRTLLALCRWNFREAYKVSYGTLAGEACQTAAQVGAAMRSLLARGIIRRTSHPNRAGCTYQIAGVDYSKE